MSQPWKPPLRLTIISSPAPKAAGRARELERILNSTAAGIGVDLGEMESTPAGTQPLGEKLELKIFQQPPRSPAPEWLEETLHSVVVVLVDQEILDDQELCLWLQEAGEHCIRQEPGRHRFIAVPFSEDLAEQWRSQSEALAELQAVSWESLDLEAAGRADQLALRVLHALVRVLSTATLEPRGSRLRIFISHAKLDGLYLARSFRDYLQRLPWLEHFYDAADIEAGVSWKQALKAAVQDSILVVLRTDTYDRRVWCRQEVKWADLFGAPRVVVDARSGLMHPGSGLALDAALTVKVPDGNLPRILFAVLQTALQSMLFLRRVRELQRGGFVPNQPDRVRILAMHPPIESLARACQELAQRQGGDPALIVYPDPPLAEGLSAAGTALAEQARTRLATPNQLVSGISA